MAPLPTPIPSNLPALLSSVRSTIFGTSHNPTNTRTGSKYLRRRLKGPSAISYYPRTLKLSTLNAETPWNPYANWRGEGVTAWKERVVGAGGSGSAGQRSKWLGIDAEVKEGEAPAQAQAEGEGEVAVEATQPARVWAAQLTQLPASELVAPGKVEVARIPGAGWVDDAKERVRAEEVEMRRAMGRGPPKKGQGKRSQLRKR